MPGDPDDVGETTFWEEHVIPTILEIDELRAQEEKLPQEFDDPLY